MCKKNKIKKIKFPVLVFFLLFVNIGCVTKKAFKEILDIDVPYNPRVSTANISEEANRSLEKIKIMISENYKILNNLSFEDYLKVENTHKFGNDSEKLNYRNLFILELNSRYKIKIP